jgi:hypothetical protein
MKAAEFAAALGGAHRSGAWWRCRCTVHGSRGELTAFLERHRVERLPGRRVAAAPPTQQKPRP